MGPLPVPVAADPQDWRDSDRYESEARAQERRDAEFLAEVLVQIGLGLAEKAAPHVGKGWNEHALPAVKAKWNDQALPYVMAKWSNVPRSRTSDRRTEVTEEPREVVTAAGDQRTTMTGAEARKRFAAAVMARVYGEGQLRLLRNARVVDEGEDGPVEPAATDDLTPQRIGEYVALMLEADPSLLGEDTLAALGRLVARVRADGGHVPGPRAEGVLPIDGTADEQARGVTAVGPRLTERVWPPVGSSDECGTVRRGRRTPS